MASTESGRPRVIACRTAKGDDLVVYTGEDHTFRGQVVAECRNPNIAAMITAWWNGADRPDLPDGPAPRYIDVVIRKSTVENHGNQ